MDASYGGAGPCEQRLAYVMLPSCTNDMHQHVIVPSDTSRGGGHPGGALSQSQVMHMGSFLTVLTAMLGERQIYASPVTKISFLGLQSQGSGIVQPPALNLGGV